MNTENKQAVEDQLLLLLPNFVGLNESSAKKILKLTQKSLTGLFKEYEYLLVQQAKELKKIELKAQKAEIKAQKAEVKAQLKIEKQKLKEIKNQKKTKLVNLVVSSKKKSTGTSKNVPITKIKVDETPVS